MIRILYVTDTLRQRSGVTSVITNYLEFMCKNEEYKIDVLAYDDSEKEIIEKLELFGAKVYLMPKLGIKQFFKFLKFLSFIKLFFVNNKYDIVHSHFNQIDSLVFPLSKKYGGVKICISHSHSTKYSDYLYKKIRNEIMCEPIPYLADIWAACSEEAGIFLYGSKFNKSPKKLIIKNGIDIDKFKFNISTRKSVREQLNLAENEMVIGHVGSFKPVKNQGFLLNVLSILKASNNNHRKYKLVLVGEGELKDAIINQAKALNLLDDVIFTGLRNDVASLMQAFDIFVLPSLYEGLPVVGIEAQASGLPCIFSEKITKSADMGGGVYLPINDFREWSEEIIATKMDCRKDFTENLNKYGFSIEEQANKLLDIYSSKLSELETL